MAYDVLIKNGTVVDGTGKQSYQADVAVQGDRIAEIGKITGSAKRTIDAEGHGDPWLCRYSYSSGCTD
jgi:N-acyl-D-aspartate/D-glutamate deacylase